jgi:hypothetical protein
MGTPQNGLSLNTKNINCMNNLKIKSQIKGNEKPQITTSKRFVLSFLENLQMRI